MSQSIQDVLHKEIEQFIANKFYEVTIDSNDDFGIITAKIKEKESARDAKIIVVSISGREVNISNILIPISMKWNNIGKDLISIIYKVVKKYNYKLFIVEFSNLSFYDSLVKRGAVVIEKDNIVQITDNTDLSQQEKYK